MGIGLGGDSCGRPQLERLSETGCCGGSGFESRAVLGGKAGLQTGQTARGGEWPSYGSKVVLDLQLARRGGGSDQHPVHSQFLVIHAWGLSKSLRAEAFTEPHEAI